MTKKIMSVAAAGVLAFAAGCGEDDKEKSSDSKSGSEGQTSKPRQAANVSFTTPAEGADVQGDTVKARVDLKSFALDAKNVGKKATPGRGHLHFSLDGGKFDFPKYSGENGKLAKMLGVDGKYSPSVTPTITYRGIPAGEHTLKVELANNDHSDTGNATEVKFRTQ